MNKKSEIVQNVDLDCFELVIPKFQREITESHVDVIVNETYKYVSNGVGVPFPPISVAKYQENFCLKFHIIDGQHRYQAYKKLYLRGIKFLVDIHVVNCINYEEAFYFYGLFNSNLRHSNAQLENPSIFSPVELEIHRWIGLSENSKYFGNDRAARPKIRINKFIDKLNKSSIKNTFTNLEDFKRYLFQVNNNMKNNFISSQSLYNYLIENDVSQSIYTKSCEIDFYLGLDKNLSWLV